MAYTTIDDSELYFQCKVYSGSSSDVTVTFDGTNDMQPDLVWLKKTSASGDPLLYDAVRGVNKRLQPSGADAEVDRSGNDDELKAFNSDGWTLGTFNSNVTGSGATCISWNWKANGTGSSNTDGTINTAATSANTTAGISIVSYTSNGSSSQTVGHGLGAVPHMIISKNRDSSSSSYNYWTVYHHKNASANDKKLKLNTNDAASTTNEWGDTDPTSSVYSLHTSGDGTTNVSTDKIVSYVWTSIKGFSKFGKYEGNGNNDGPVVYTGFKPAMIWCKGVNSNREWIAHDNKRDPINTIDGIVYLNTDDANGTGTDKVDFLANGFKYREDGNNENASGETYLYAAFAESPFVNSNGLPTTAR